MDKIEVFFEEKELVFLKKLLKKRVESCEYLIDFFTEKVEKDSNKRNTWLLEVVLLQEEKDKLIDLFMKLAVLG